MLEGIRRVLPDKYELLKDSTNLNVLKNFISTHNFELKSKL